MDFFLGLDFLSLGLARGTRVPPRGGSRHDVVHCGAKVDKASARSSEEKPAIDRGLTLNEKGPSSEQTESPFIAASSSPFFFFSFFRQLSAWRR